MDLNSVFPLFPLTTDANGNWYQVVLIPHHPAYAGLMLRIQAAVASPLSLTNAIELTLGY
jgi:hypothetical protein